MKEMKRKNVTAQNKGEMFSFIWTTTLKQSVDYIKVIMFLFVSGEILKRDAKLKM